MAEDIPLLEAATLCSAAPQTHPLRSHDQHARLHVVNDLLAQRSSGLPAWDGPSARERIDLLGEVVECRSPHDGFNCWQLHKAEVARQNVEAPTMGGVSLCKQGIHGNLPQTVVWCAEHRLRGSGTTVSSRRANDGPQHLRELTERDEVQSGIRLLI